MILNNKQKRAIRSHYPTMTLRFRPDGTVEGKKGKGTTFNVLYTPEQTQEHIVAMKKK